MKKKLFIILLILGILLGSNVEAVVKRFQYDSYTRTLTTGLVSYWNMEGNSNDYYGSNNGTDTSVSYGTSYGKVGQGALFNGSSSGINVGSNSSLNLTSNQSVSMWVNPSNQPGNNLQYRLYDNSGSSPYGIYISYLNYGGTMKLTIAYNSSPSVASQPNQVLNNGTWYHLVFVHNDTTDTDTVYVNGSALTPITGATSNPGSQAGNKYIGVEGGTGKWWPGDIDEVAIWSRALSTTEIANLYHLGLGQTMCTYGTTCRIIQGSGITR